LFANNAEFTSLSLEASYFIKDNFGITAGFAAALRGEIIAAASSYTIVVFYQLK